MDLRTEQPGRHGSYGRYQGGQYTPRVAAADFNQSPAHVLLHLVRSAGEDHLPPMQQTDSRTAFRFVEIRRGDENRDLFFQQPIQDSPKVPPGQRVDAIGRFIQQQYLGSMNQCTGKRQFLFHAAGQVPGLAVPKFGHVAEREEFRDFFLPRLPGYVVQVGVKVDILLHRQVQIKPETLRHIADMMPELFRILHRMASVHPGISRRRRHQPCEQAHHGRLACAIRSHESKYFSLFEGKCQIVYRCVVAKCLRQSLGANGLHDLFAAQLNHCVCRHAGFQLTGGVLNVYLDAVHQFHPFFRRLNTLGGEFSL